MKPAKIFNEKDFLFKSAFDADAEIQKYKPNDLSIFVLSLHLRIDDIAAFATDAITEGGDDKKADICYIDLSEKRAIIVQSYLSQTSDVKLESDRESLNINIEVNAQQLTQEMTGHFGDDSGA